MNMTNERLEEISEALMKDQDKAKELLMKTPEESLAWFNAQGYDFTMDEIKEFAERLNVLVQAKNSGELDEASLEDVAGGRCYSWSPPVAAILIGVAIVTCPW